MLSQKFGTALSSRIGRAIAIFFIFMFHTVMQCKEVFKKWRKILYLFVDNPLLFQTVKESSCCLTVNEVIAKSSTPRF